MKFDTSDVDSGVFFVSELDFTETKVNQVGELSNSRIVFQISASLGSGTYRLVVRKEYGQELREGNLPERITINEGGSGCPSIGYSF